MHKRFLQIICFLNRNIRYGKSENRLLQFLVIRARNILKKIIFNNNDRIALFGTTIISLKHAGKMKLLLNDYIDKWLYTGADFEPQIVELFRKHLKKGDVLLDLGANIGYFTLIGSKLIGDKGKVYSFEPGIEMSKRLRENIAMNQRRNITVIEKAVSNESGVAVFRIPVDTIRNSGRSSLRQIEENYVEINVETISLDAMMTDLAKVKMIKMDIEGAEGLALAGMKQLIDRDHPIIIMELSDNYLRQMGYSAKDILKYFEDFEYNIFVVGHLITPITSIDYASHSQCDILCIPAGYKNQDI